LNTDLNVRGLGSRYALESGAYDNASFEEIKVVLSPAILRILSFTFAPATRYQDYCECNLPFA